MSQWLCTTIRDEMSNTSARSDVQTGTTHMRDQLNHDSNVSTTFEQYDSSYDVTVDTSDEIQYIKDALQELYNNGETVDGDAWIIVDGADTWGYGRGGVKYTTDDGAQTLWGARVFHTPSQLSANDPVQTFYNLTIHELAHCFKADHEDGSYDDRDTNNARNATPMATAYTYDDDDSVDTCWEGGGTIPSTFDCGPDNRKVESWCGNCGDTCVHQVGMTSCTRSTIDSFSPL